MPDLQHLIQLITHRNLAEGLDTSVLSTLGDTVVRLTKVDDASRSDWIKKSETAMDLALQIVKNKTLPWENSSNIVFPTITVAALQFHARSYPAIISGQQIVKGKVSGSDDDGQKLAKSRRIAQHMNWQLLEENEDWEEDEDKMLLAISIEGCEFKKTYYDNVAGYNKSEWVRPEDFIVNSATKALSSCPRATHRMWFYPYQIMEKMRAGIWIDAELNISQDEVEDEIAQEFYEQHTYLDLDGDGFKEPYIVTVHVKSSKVVRVVAGYYLEDVVIEYEGVTGKLRDLLNTVDEATLSQIKDVRVIRINKLQSFTKFGFIPSPDGGFYDIGFGHLVGPLNDSINTIINQLTDAGTLSNMQGGFAQEGISIDGKRGPIKYKRGEFKPIKVPGNIPLAQAIFQVKFPEPSVVLFQLLGLLVQSAKDITSIQDIMMGAPQEQGQAATTSMIQVEQGMKVFTSIYKRIHRSHKQEFKKLYILNGRFLQPEQYFRVLDTQEGMVAKRSDYMGDGTDVQPVSDPQLAVSALAITKAQTLMSVMQHPSVNDDEVLRRFFEAVDVPQPETLFTPPEQRQPPPDPELMLKAQIAASEHSKRMADLTDKLASAINRIADAESKEVGPQAMEYIETLKQVIASLSNGQQPTAGMAGPSPNQGNVQGVQAPPAGVGGGSPATGVVPGQQQRQHSPHVNVPQR